MKYKKCSEKVGTHNEAGVDIAKLTPITFDPVNNAYHRLSEKIGDTFKGGLKLG